MIYGLSRRYESIDDLYADCLLLAAYESDGIHRFDMGTVVITGDQVGTVEYCVSQSKSLWTDLPRCPIEVYINTDGNQSVKVFRSDGYEHSFFNSHKLTFFDIWQNTIYARAEYIRKTVQ